MERAERRRRRRRVAVAVAVAVLVLLCVAVAVGVAARLSQATFKHTFLARCEDFKGNDCEKIWSVFEKAYVGRNHCEVPVEAYDPLLAAVPFAPLCNRMMFWSKTKDVVHDLTGKRDCYVTMENTLLGAVLDGLTWCGKEGSTETFESGCPGWRECLNNPVRSFWTKASAAGLAVTLRHAYRKRTAVGAGNTMHSCYMKEAESPLGPAPLRP